MVLMCTKANRKCGPSWGFWEQGNKAIYFRGTREQTSKTEWNRGTQELLGNREHRKSRFWFWGSKEMSVGGGGVQGNKGTGTHPGRASEIISLVVSLVNWRKIYHMYSIPSSSDANCWFSPKTFCSSSYNTFMLRYTWPISQVKLDWQ